MIPAFVTPSPFPLKANLSIFLEVPTTGVTIDPNTGNEIPNSTTTELKATVVRASETESQYRQPAGKIESIELKGFVTCGKVPFSLSGTYPAILRGRTTAEDIRGEFDVLPTVTPFINEITQSIGLPITGIFRRLE